MNLIFSCTCFLSADVFLLWDGRQLRIGSIRVVGVLDDLEYWPDDFYVARGEYGLTAADIPTAEAVLAEYRKQCEERGVWINKGIRLAG